MSDHGNSSNTVCVDFDGTLNTYRGWRGPNDLYLPRPGARHFLAKLRARGYRVVILTTRDAASVSDWLQKHGLAKYVDFVTNQKVRAFAYVDDRAIPFRGNYDQTLEELKTFRPYWKLDDQK